MSLEILITRLKEIAIKGKMKSNKFKPSKLQVSFDFVWKNFRNGLINKNPDNQNQQIKA